MAEIISNLEPYSPHTNANLLQRSEVVALINTLHRFSESLEAVNMFRHIWADMSSAESEQVILEAEKAASPIVSLECILTRVILTWTHRSLEHLRL